MVATSDHRIASGRDGLKVFLRNKCPDGGGRTLLLVHGATYPSTAVADYPVEGVSAMDWLAANGFDVWCIDLLGYGKADRPPEMDDPAEANPPLVDTNEAVADVRRAIEFICEERNITELGLLGYSWGTAICGQVATEVPGRVDRLALVGALWLKAGSVQIQTDGAIGAYRTVTPQDTTDRWTVYFDDAKKAAVCPESRREQWGRAAVATDPGSVDHDPPRLRSPAGVVKDVVDYWLQGKPTYDPGKIKAPTLVIVGEWDQETTTEQGWEVFSRLTSAAEKRYVVVGQSSHTIWLEDNRHQLYGSLAEFLGGNRPNT
jgi:pimeloyl-ACP methyl ester carboxylesterase